MKHYKRLFFFKWQVLVIFLFSCIASNTLGQNTRLPQEVINDFSYNAYREFNYGTGAFQALIIRSLTQKGYGIADIHVAIEQLSKNRKYQDDIFQALDSFFGTRNDMLLLNLVGMKVKATNARKIVEYLQKKHEKVIVKLPEKETTYSFSNSIVVPKGYAIYSSITSSTLTSALFETLKKYKNKYPTSSGLFQNPIVVNELKRVLGVNYNHFVKEKNQWYKESQIEVTDNVLFSYIWSGGEDQPHAAIFCDLKERKTYLLVAELTSNKPMTKTNIDELVFKIKRSMYGDFPFTDAVKRKIKELIQQESDYGFKEQKLDSLLAQ